jgi:hypothetical protein
METQEKSRGRGGLFRFIPPAPAEETEMKFLGAVMMMGLTATGWANPPQSVTVCLKGAREKYVSASTQMASEIFVAAGVEVDWRDAGDCPSSPNVINVIFSFFVPADYRPGALAYALPFEGTTINIFYNRIAHRAPDWTRQLLAYVLVHEITHILQGVSHHSKDGIMKAVWSNDEFKAMRTRSLGFAAEDVTMIDLGLQARVRLAVTRRTEIASR